MIKRNKILNINEIIKIWGVTNSDYLKLTKLPCQSLFNNKSVTSMLETYFINFVLIKTSQRGKINEVTIPYEKLDEKILYKIYDVLTKYEKKKNRNKYLSIL